MAFTIKPEGICQTVTPANGTDFKLKEVQKIVGDDIELIYLADNLIALVAENGLYKEMPYNAFASSFIGRSIVGTVLICKRSEFN